MANFETSQIRLPNNDLLILKDTTARTAAATAQTTAETAQTTADSKVTIVSWDATNKKLTKTINGSTTDIVAGSTILSGLTKAQVTSALGYTPPTEDTNTTYSLTQDSTDKHKFTLSGTDGSSVTVTIPDNNTTYTFAEGTTNGAFTVTPSGKSAQTVKIHGLGNAAYKGISDTYSSTSTDAISGKGVAAALASLPTPMVFKGSLGTGGTITTLPTASASNNGHSYKVITNGTYAGVSAKAGDMFISDGTQWVYIPSADEPSGTVTSVGIANGGGLSVSGSPITTSGTITISHADTSSQASVNNSGRTYIQDITLDTYGHVTGITSATETVVDTNTTYTIGTSGNNITLTPSSGSAQSVTAPYATKALNNKDGESITATYRRLDDPYYDTVYATEEEVGDLIVTGAARFLNTINGSISGNAATATNVAWSGVTGKPTTLGGYGITDAKIANGVITLGSNTITPLTSHQTVSNKGATLAWATTSTIATIGGTDIKVTMPSNPNTNTTYTLGADTKNNKITLTPSSGDVQSITVPYATSAGSAGSATKATQDESGNNIKASYASSISISDHTITLKNKNGVSLGTVTVPDNATDNTKLPLAGGTMTGQIVLASSGYKTNNTAGYSADQYGNFQHLSTTTSDFWQLKSNNGATKFLVYWESGNVTATGNITAPKFIGALDEANLAWGGKNFSASYGCIDAALMDELGANRFQFIKADAITVEYSRDGGTTWTDYGATDAQKQQIFAQGGGLIIGKADSANKATEHPGLYQLRITIDTGVANIYSVLHKFIVYISSSGSANCACKIQKALQSTPTTFVDHTDWISIGGWSGYNVLNTNNLGTYGNTTSSQYGRVRFIFKDGEGGNTNYIGLSILQIKAFGGVGWLTPSTMAKTGHLYAYNENQDALFPNMVQAPYHKGTTKMTLSSGKITQLTAGTAMLFADGVAISNPTTANDVGWIRVLGTGESDTVMEIATGDDGGAGEQIVIRQYNTSSTIVNEATLLDKSGNTTFPKNVTATKFIGALQGNADTATKATQDGSGNTITSTYLKLSGGSLNNGAQIVAKTNDTSNSQIYNGGIQLREYNGGGSTLEETLYNAPGISFHWSGKYAGKLSLYTGGHLYFQDKPIGTFTQTAPTSGQVVITDGTTGGIKSSGYTIATSVPSNAEFTDTKYTAGTGLTLSGTQFSVSSANASTIMNLLTTGSSAPTDNDYYIAQYAGGGTSTTSYHRRPHSALWSYIKAKADTTYVNITGDTMSGNLAVTNVLGIAQTAGTSGGISLYGGTGQVDTYGIAFRLTSNKEKHGYVQGDWATYFTMNSGATTRGWVFRTNTTNGNVASISGGGNAVFNGSVTVGGNTTNTSGCRQVYNEETQSLDFVFVA